MRVPLLIAAVTLTVSCASHSGSTPAPNTPEDAVDSLTPGHAIEAESRTYPSSDSLNPLIDADPATLSSGPHHEDDSPPTTQLVPASLHHDHEPFAGPLPLPSGPSRTGEPLDLFVWVGYAILNYSPDQPFPDPGLREVLSPTLLLEPRELDEPSPGSATWDSSRAVMLDAWINAEVSTQTLVHGVVVFERTLGSGNEADSKIQVVSLDLTAHSTANGWQVIDLQVSS